MYPWFGFNVKTAATPLGIITSVVSFINGVFKYSTDPFLPVTTSTLWKVPRVATGENCTDNDEGPVRMGVT